MTTITLRAHAAALALAALAGCAAAPSGAPAPSAERGGPIDPNATAETRALFFNLRRLARQHVLFGHQDDLAYGHDWVAEPGRSDVRESSGSYPAVYGWEVSGIERSSPKNIDGVDFDRMRGWIAEGYRRGGVITISWHLDNPLTGRNAWDTTSAVAAILPGGARHETVGNEPSDGGGRIGRDDVGELFRRQAVFPGGGQEAERGEPALARGRLGHQLRLRRFGVTATRGGMTETSRYVPRMP